MVWARSARWSFALLALLSSACSTPRHGIDQVSSSQLITEEEVEASHANSAFDVIAKVRANFLTYRGETSFDKSRSKPYPTVWVDGMEYGPIATLKNVPAAQIATIRLYRSWEATTKFGANNTGGVIEIITRQ
jgi:outer membrane cobalamin receptor